MRVLAIGNMYPPHHLGGYELAWQGGVGHLRAAGHEVRVLTTDHRQPEGETQPEEPDVHRELRWYWEDHRFPRMGARARLSLERHNARVLPCHLDDFKPDVVTWWGMGGMSLSMVERVRRAGIPSVGFVHDEWMIYGPTVDAWSRAFAQRPRLGRAVERVTAIPTRLDLGPAARWLFNSDAIRRDTAHRIDLGDWGVVHPGIDRALFRPGPELPWRWRLLYVGRIDPRKGIDTAIRALERLPEATLTVCGTGDRRHLRELEELAESVGDRVRFEVRPRSRIPEAYAEADATLFPVKWEEPFGLVPLESMAVGTPVVATGTGGSAEYLRHEGNCLIYRPRDDPGALARAVERLAADPALRGRLRDGGLTTAAQHDESAFGAAVVEAVEAAARP